MQTIKKLQRRHTLLTDFLAVLFLWMGMNSVAQAQANQPPLIQQESVTQRVDASGLVDISLNVRDNQNQNTKLRVRRAVRTGGSCGDETFSLKPTLNEAPGAVTASVQPPPNLENDDDYQVGTTTPILTTATNTLQFIWDSLGDGIAEQAMCLALTASDGIADSNIKYVSIDVDNATPQGLNALLATSQTSVSITFNWSAVTESNFNHYEVWYGTNQADVQNRAGTALEWDDDNDPQLRLRQTTSSTVTGLTLNTPYYFKMWAFDNFGNQATVADIQVTTAASDDSPGRRGGSSNPSHQGRGKRQIGAQVAITLSLGEHRDKAMVRLINQIRDGKRPDKDLLRAELSKNFGDSKISHVSQIKSSPQAKSAFLKMMQDEQFKKTVRGQRSDKLILEVWNPSDSSKPVATVNVSTNVFGEAEVTLPPLPEGVYDFTIRKPFGLPQPLTGITLQDSFELNFPKPLRAGDVNGDGKINRTDFQEFLNRFKEVQANPSDYDLTEDGMLDLNDMVDLMQGWSSE